MYRLKVIEVIDKDRYLIKVRILKEDIELFCKKYELNQRKINLTDKYLEIEVNKDKVIAILNSDERVGKLKKLSIKFKKNKSSEVVDTGYKILEEEYIKNLFYKINQEYEITPKQIDYIKEEVNNLELEQYEHKINEIINIFNITKIDSRLKEVLTNQELKIDINDFTKEEKEEFINIIKLKKFSNKFIVMIFNKNINLTYRKNVVKYLKILDITNIKEEQIISIFFKYANINSGFFKGFEEEVNKTIN